MPKLPTQPHQASGGRILNSSQGRASRNTSGSIPGDDAHHFAVSLVSKYRMCWQKRDLLW